MRCCGPLLLLLLTSTFAFGQVGVNNPTPTQALDVNGKIRVTDDATAPEQGTIRFNDTTDEFEGYDGTEWKVLSLEKSGGAPTAPIAYTGRTSPISVNNSEAASCNWQRVGIVGTPGPLSFTTVPAGQYFLVTMVNIVDNNLSGEEYMDVNIRAGTTFSRFPASLRLSGSNRAQTALMGDTSNPILILRPGERVRIFNNSNSETTINVNFRGFLVDELDF